MEALTHAHYLIVLSLKFFEKKISLNYIFFQTLKLTLKTG